MKTYLQHLINWTRVKSVAWFFAASILAEAFLTLGSNPHSWTWENVQAAFVASIIFQITKAFKNYSDELGVQKERELY